MQASRWPKVPGILPSRGGVCMTPRTSGSSVHSLVVKGMPWRTMSSRTASTTLTDGRALLAISVSLPPSGACMTARRVGSRTAPWTARQQLSTMTPRARRSSSGPVMRRFLALGSLVVAVGALNAWYRLRGGPGHSTSHETVQPESPLTLADVMQLPESPHDMNIELYQYSYQPSSCQIRTYLDLHKFKYISFEVNPLNKNPLPYPPPARKTKQVPLLYINNREISVAAHCLLFLERYVNRLKHKQPSQEELGQAGELMSHIDQHLVQLVQVNRYATLRAASRSMAPLRRAAHLSVWERVFAPPIAAFSLWLQWKKSRRFMRQIYGDDLKQALVDELDNYARILGVTLFFGDEEPGMVDVYLYGALRSIADEDLGKYVLSHADARLLAWYQRMTDLLITNASGIASTG